MFAQTTFRVTKSVIGFGRLHQHAQSLISKIGSHTNLRILVDNLDLLQRIAESIVNFLIENYGVDSTQIVGNGCGGEEFTLSQIFIPS